MDPAVSVPSPMSACPVDTADAGPDEGPPLMRPGVLGLGGVP
jgi:hypothetical protein